MFCEKGWTAVLSALAVVCAAVLVAFSRDAVFGGVAGIVCIACVSLLWWRAQRAGASCEAKEGVAGDEAIARAIDAVLDGEDKGAAETGPAAAQALERLKDRLQALESEVTEMSPRDELTSLAKEEVFNNVLWREFSRAIRYKTPLSLVMVEVEGLAGLRQSGGREAGEKLVRHVASVLLQTVRETDLAARYGEERFAVIMPETGRQGATDFSVRLRNAMKESAFKVGAVETQVSLAIGAASVPSEEVKTAPDLVERAGESLSRGGG